MCTHIHTYMYIKKVMTIYKYVQKSYDSASTWNFISVHIYMYVYIYVYTHTYIVMHIKMVITIHKYIRNSYDSPSSAYVYMYEYIYVYTHTYIYMHIKMVITIHKYKHNSYDSPSSWYGVATISRLLQIICLFCKRALQKRLYSARETYNFKEPTNRSHHITLKS